MHFFNFMYFIVIKYTLFNLRNSCGGYDSSSTVELFCCGGNVWVVMRVW